MAYKICVYAICKNEEAFIDRWLDSMQEADYIVVMDTGSTDNTVSRLKEDSRVTRVEVKEIKPWRFDVARNESMKLIPEDTDICVCTDFDEFFEPGWATILRDSWREDDNRCYYTYAWSHNDLGEPTDVFKYDKIHTRTGYHWKFPVHEILEKDDPNMKEMALDAGESIYLHHTPDTSKSRSSYMPLLELAVEENPEECHCRTLLAREYLLYGNYEKAIEEYKKCLEYENIYTTERRMALLETYLRIGDGYYALEDYIESTKWYYEALKMDTTYREPYFCLADTYNWMGLYTLAEAMVKAGFEYSTRKFDWIERKDNWIAKGNDILSVAQYNLGKADEAYENIKIAYDHNPNDMRIIKNMNEIMRLKIENLERQLNSDNNE